MPKTDAVTASTRGSATRSRGWHRRIPVRILAVTVFAIVLIELIILVPTTLMYRESARQRFFDEASAAGLRLAPQLSESLDDPPSELLARLDEGTVEGSRAAIFDKFGGAVAYQSEFPVEAMSARVVEALRASPAPFVEGEDGERCFVLFPLLDSSGMASKIMVLTKPGDRIASETWRFVLRILGLVFVICVFTASVMIVFLYRDVVVPIDTIVAANVASAGDPVRAPRIPASEVPDTELGEIMRTRNRMLDRLDEAREKVVQSHAQLEELNSTLEKRVDERTALLEAERERAAQSEKLAEIGRLAASVAHEINNPLGIIAASAEEMRRELRRGQAAPLSDSERGLEVIDSQVKRCSSIIDSLMKFSRKTATAVERVDVRDLLAETERLVHHRAVSESKELALRIEGDPGAVLSRRTHVQQALVNLLENALDAVPEGGSVTLGASRSPEEIRLWVADDGPGLPKDVASKAFDPFFTTKEPGRGAGMGLTIAANFVRALGGELELRSDEGQGAQFTIRLPIGDEENFST